MLDNEKVKGYKVFDFKNRNIGTVLSVVWEGKKELIDGFLILKSKFLQVKFYLPFSSINKIENGNIYLIKSYKTKAKEISLSPLEVKIGKNKAYVSKFVFDEKNGRVKQIQVAKNIYEDLKNGRQTYDKFTISKGLITIDNGSEK